MGKIKQLKSSKMKKIFLIITVLFAMNAKAQLTLTEQYNLAQNDTFQLKVKTATLKAANDILAGVDRSPYLINYAQVVVLNPTGNDWINSISHGVTTNVAIDENSTDSDIQFTVNSLFVKYAKAYYKVLD
jgi:hypothetical protein